MINKPDSCADVIRYLATCQPEILGLCFIAFESYDLIQERINVEGELNKIITNALEIRSKYNFPFWDSFNVSMFNQPFDDFQFLSEVKFHNKISSEFQIENKLLSQFLIDQSKNENYLTISSKVTLTSGEIKHFPLLDFHIPVSIENEQICVEIIKILELKGFLLDSGKSYHFYANQLICESELINMLSYALLYSPIIDRAWVAHQLIERRCCLRISKKYSRLPFIVREV